MSLEGGFCIHYFTEETFDSVKFGLILGQEVHLPSLGQTCVNELLVVGFSTMDNYF